MSRGTPNELKARIVAAFESRCVSGAAPPNSIRGWTNDGSRVRQFVEVRGRLSALRTGVKLTGGIANTRDDRLHGVVKAAAGMIDYLRTFETPVRGDTNA